MTIYIVEMEIKILKFVCLSDTNDDVWDMYRYIDGGWDFVDNVSCELVNVYLKNTNNIVYERLY